MNCNHVFEGRADGVHCKKCSLHLTPKEYAETLKVRKEPKAVKRQKERTAEKSEAVNE